MCIDLLFANADFSSALLEHLIAEEKVCKDVHRLTAILDVSLCLLGPNNDEAAVSLVWHNVFDCTCGLFVFLILFLPKGCYCICLQISRAFVSESPPNCCGESVCEVAGDARY